MFILRGIMYLCALITALGLLSIALGGLNELFDLGIWDNDYPGIFSQTEGSEGQTISEPVSYGTFAKEAGILVGIAILVGTPLFYFFGED